MSLTVRHEDDAGQDLGYSVVSGLVGPSRRQYDFGTGSFVAPEAVGTAIEALSESSGLYAASIGSTPESAWTDGPYRVRIHASDDGGTTYGDPVAIYAAAFSGGDDGASGAVRQRKARLTDILRWTMLRLVAAGVFVDGSCDLAIDPEVSPRPGHLFGRVLAKNGRSNRWNTGGGRHTETVETRIAVRVCQLRTLDRDSAETYNLAGPEGPFDTAHDVIDALDGRFAVDHAGHHVSAEPLWFDDRSEPGRLRRNSQYVYVEVAFGTLLHLDLAV